MKLTKCANGHFYDAEKFQTCPHCSGAGMGGQGNESLTDCVPKGSYGSNSATDKTIGKAIDQTVGARGGQSPQNSQGTDEGKTVGFMDNRFQQSQQVFNRAPQGINVRPDDEGKTVGFMAWNPQSASAPAQSQEPANNNPQPVVGWLVCTEGSCFGRSFNLYCGKNFIGRSADMDVCLAGDATVSRVRHAIIIYEPKERKFFAQPGDSHELFYLNENVVLSSAELADRDVITIGKTSLVFVPFCDGRFGWEAKKE